MVFSFWKIRHSKASIVKTLQNEKGSLWLWKHNLFVFWLRAEKPPWNDNKACACKEASKMMINPFAPFLSFLWITSKISLEISSGAFDPVSCRKRKTRNEGFSFILRIINMTEKLKLYSNDEGWTSIFQGLGKCQRC